MSSQTSTIKLYSYFRSSCAYRVRIAMNIKSIPYETIPIHLLKNGGMQNSENYSRLNPSRQVPALLDGPFLLSQSMAILEYLEEQFPRPALLPHSSRDRALVRQMCEVINSGIQPLQNISVTQFLTGPMQISDEQKERWLQHWITRGLDSIETLIKKHGGNYAFGDTITLVDCFLIPQVFSSRRFKVDMNAFPRSTEIYNRCMQLTDFVKASPEKQPDFEP